TACFHDERGICPLPGAGCAAEQDDLFRKTKVLQTKFIDEGFPHRGENHLGVFNFHLGEMRYLGGLFNGILHRLVHPPFYRSCKRIPPLEWPFRTLASTDRMAS